MRYRRFGRLGWRVGEVGLGGAWLGGRRNELPLDIAAETVRRALELGVNYIDTAPVYGNYYSERIIGCALEGWRGEVFVATKVGRLPEGFDYSKDGVWRSFEGSLERLRRDYVDLLQIHESEVAGWEGVFGRGKVLEAIKEMRDQGLVRGIGITGADLDLLARAVETGEFDSVLTYNKYDLVTQEAKHKLVPVAQEHDVAVILGSPLHMGLLGGRKEELLRDRPSYVTEDMVRKLGRLEGMAREFGDSLAQFALRYLLSDPRVSIVIPATHRPERVEENVAVSEGPRLPEELVREIESL